jgi:acyl carrier protein
VLGSCRLAAAAIPFQRLVRRGSALRVSGDRLAAPGMRRQLMPTADEIYTKVRETLVDALGVDDDEVTPEATLVGDLGAESIDFLDIVFRLEKNFAIKIPRGELFPESLAADTSLVQDGKVTEKGIAELRTRMSHADIDKFAKDPKVENIQELFTVQMIVNFVAKKLAGGAA